MAIHLKRPLIYDAATARLPFNSGDEMVDLTNNKIRPFFHIKNFKDGVADAVLGRTMTKAGRSSEYEEGYEFGLTLVGSDILGELTSDEEE
jgi:hypothetical protein